VKEKKPPGSQVKRKQNEMAGNAMIDDIPYTYTG
jgi:hypothetical protein